MVAKRNTQYYPFMVDIRHFSIYYNRVWLIICLILINQEIKHQYVLMERNMDRLKILEEELKREREKLNLLIHKALHRPIAKNEEILAQRRIVDNLANIVVNEKNKKNLTR